MGGCEIHGEIGNSEDEVGGSRDQWEYFIIQCVSSLRGFNGWIHLGW